MPRRACRQCGSRHEVKLYSPDMDIDPVPLCVICWFDILGAACHRTCPCPCHKTVQPGLVPCPTCEHSSRSVATEEGA